MRWEYELCMRKWGSVKRRKQTKWKRVPEKQWNNEDCTLHSYCHCSAHGSLNHYCGQAHTHVWDFIVKICKDPSLCLFGDGDIFQHRRMGAVPWPAFLAQQILHTSGYRSNAELYKNLNFISGLFFSTNTKYGHTLVTM